MEEKNGFIQTNKSCCFIGHKKITITDELKNTIKTTAKNLIEREHVSTFLFGSNSNFIDLGYDIISELKKEFPYLVRVYIRAEYPFINKEYAEYLATLFEESFYFDSKQHTSKFSYIKRNRLLIDKSDFCLFYYDENYTPEKNRTSGTKISFHYATSKGKNLINFKQ